MSKFKKIVAMGVFVGFVGALAVVVAAVTVAQQRGGRGRMGGPMHGRTAERDQRQIEQRCRQYMERRRQRLDEIRAMERRLQDRVEMLDTAQDDQARRDALVLLVNELADQHIRMFETIQQMHEDGLRHMGMHMRRGPGSMMGCPMMSDDLPEDADGEEVTSR
ncbi:MAG: hypothetical protein ACOC7R_02600 [Planctomycetota bacterium]